MDLVTIDRFVFLADAEIARATLEAAGIDAVLIEDRSKPENVRLQVHTDDVEAAREILSARVEMDDEHAGMLDGDEQCRRCFSTEIYPAETRAKTYARIVVFGGIVLVGTRLTTGALRMMGHQVSAQIDTGMFALFFIACIFAVLYATVAQPKRCRNCGLEWRGTQRPS